MHLVGPVTELLTLLEFVCDVRIAGGCDKGWEPVEPRYNSIFNFARRYPAGPADDHRNSETAFECRALASGKRSLSTIGPSEVLGPVVGREGKDRVALKTIVPNVLHDRANNVVELRHSGFLNSPAVLGGAHVLYKRCWKPLQLACGLTVDSGRKDEEGNSMLDPRYGFHMLRHAAASLFIAYLGWSPKRVQTVMGHSSINMTFDRYGHLFENTETDRGAMEKIEAAITAA